MEIRKKHLNVSLTHEIVGGGGSRMTDNIFQVFFSRILELKSFTPHH